MEITRQVESIPDLLALANGRLPTDIANLPLDSGVLADHAGHLMRRRERLVRKPFRGRKWKELIADFWFGTTNFFDWNALL